MAQQHETPPSIINQRWLNFFVPLFLPDIATQDIVSQRQRRLLVELVLLTAVLTVSLDLFHWVVTPIYQQKWLKYGLLVVVLLLNRVNLYRWAAMLAVAYIPILVFIELLTRTTSVPVNLLNYLMVGVLVSSLLLTLRETAVVAVTLIIATLLLPLLQSHRLGFNHIMSPLTLTAVTSLLLALLMRQRDFTEQHRQKALQTSQEQLKMALNSAKMGTWYWDMATGQIEWSVRSLDIFGLPLYPRTYPYAAYLAATHPEDRAKVETAVQTAVQKKAHDYEIEHRILWPDGSTHWIHARGTVYSDKVGQPIAMLGLVSDVTAYRQALDALRHSEERFRALAENIPGVIYLCQNDADWTMLYLNDRIETLTGYAKERFLSGELSFAALCHPDDVAMMHQRIDQSIREERPFSLSYRIQHKNGQWRWIEETGVGIQQDDENWLLEGFVIDVTQRKEIDLALQTSEEMHRLLLTSIQTPVLALTETMDILFCNTAYAAMVGHPVSALEGQNLIQLFPNLIERSSYRAYQEALQTGTAQEVEGWSPQGVYWRVHVYRTPWGVLALSEDLTERQQMQEMHEGLIEELAAKNQELERFTYTVSHDLKSPLVTVKGFVGFLEQDARKGDMAQVGKDIEHINTAVERMQNLLNDLLELSRIGRLINPPHRIPFRTLIQEALGMVAGQLASQQVEVTIQPDLPAVYGDQPRLVQMLQNLLDNAIKYMGDQPHPFITIGCRQRDGETHFFVQDNGMGIDPHHHEQVFELFERLDRPGDGTGIGLALVKRIVEVHNGRIWLESDGKQGTTFCFTLPLA